MRVADVMARVQDIARCAGDSDAAHGMEDQLTHDVLAAIAAGDHGPEDTPAQLASAALASKALPFSRWTA